METKYILESARDREKAYREIWSMMLEDIAGGKIPTFHIIHIERDGTIDNHYMTPISLEPVDDKGNRAVYITDFEFFLKMLLRSRKTIEVAYNRERPAVVFIYID